MKVPILLPLSYKFSCTRESIFKKGMKFLLLLSLSCRFWSMRELNFKGEDEVPAFLPIVLWILVQERVRYLKRANVEFVVVLSLSSPLSYKIWCKKESTFK